VKGERLNAAVDTSVDYDQLYSSHRARVIRLCRLLLSNLHDAEEVSQEVFLKLLEVYRRGDRSIAWGPWLTRVTINACRDRRRAGWWKWVWDRRGDVDLGEWASADGTPEELAVSREQCRQIWQAFRTLSARQQEVFALRCVEEWSTEATADALGMSSGSVKRHLFRAVRQLRQALGSGR